MSVFSLNITTILGLGLGIDYGLFLVTRFREELHKQSTVQDAVARTVATAGRTVLVSGITVAIVLASLMLFPETILRSIGYGGVATVLVDMLAALTVLLGFTPNGTISPTIPVLMFAIMFGLSMDYQVFLLSRIRESYDITGDNAASIASGLQRTGGVITSAALLLVIVIGAFSVSSITFIKLLGVGMIVALILDATLVRLLLVPAIMRLAGNANWWATRATAPLLRPARHPRGRRACAKSSRRTRIRTRPHLAAPRPRSATQPGTRRVTSRKEHRNERGRHQIDDATAKPATWTYSGRSRTRQPQLSPPKGSWRAVTR